jgi:8-oxo-dGTP pyrophosphatase MutT (NUDIX family)
MSHTGDTMCYTAEVFIVYRGRVLLRMHDKYHFWCSIGGHVEKGEDPNEAALREVKEEVGLDIVLWDKRQQYTVHEGSFKNIVPPVALNRHETGDGHEHVTFVFFAETASDAVVPERPEDEWRWVSKEELATMDLKENIREYAIGAIASLAE